MKGWDSNLNLGSKVVERLRMSLLHCMGFLSSTNSVFAEFLQIYLQIFCSTDSEFALCAFHPLQPPSICGAGVSSFVLPADLGIAGTSDLGPGGTVLTMPDFKKRCKLAVQEESSHRCRSKEKQQEQYGWTDKPAVLQTGWLDGIGWKQKALGCWRKHLAAWDRLQRNSEQEAKHEQK